MVFQCLLQWTTLLSELSTMTRPSWVTLHSMAHRFIELDKTSSSARTPKLQLTAEQPSTGECWIPPKKDTPHPRTKEKPQQDGRRGKIGFRIKPRTCQRCSEDSNKTLCAPGDFTETELDLPLRVWVSPVEVQVSSCLLQGQGLWVQQSWVWHKPSWRRSPLTPP